MNSTPIERQYVLRSRSRMSAEREALRAVNGAARKNLVQVGLIEAVIFRVQLLIVRARQAERIYLRNHVPADSERPHELIDAVLAHRHVRGIVPRVERRSSVHGPQHRSRGRLHRDAMPGIAFTLQGRRNGGSERGSAVRAGAASYSAVRNRAIDAPASVGRARVGNVGHDPVATRV